MKEYYANVLLNFQNPALPKCPINHSYQILNGLCMPIMHSKSHLLDELDNLQADNKDIEEDYDDYSSDEDKFDDELHV